MLLLLTFRDVLGVPAYSTSTSTLPFQSSKTTHFRQLHNWPGPHIEHGSATQAQVSVEIHADGISPHAHTNTHRICRRDGRLDQTRRSRTDRR